MLINLNKLKEKKARLVLNERYIRTKTGLEGKLFDRKIIKEYMKQCGDTYFHKNIPLSINIEVNVSSRVNSLIKKNRYITNLPNVNIISQVISKSLVCLAYDSEYQIAELFITKVYGDENKIVIEIEML